MTLLFDSPDWITECDTLSDCPAVVCDSYHNALFNSIIYPSGADWATSDLTLSESQIRDPFGGFDAVHLQGTGASTSFRNDYYLASPYFDQPTGDYTCSCFFKQDDSPNATIHVIDNDAPDSIGQATVTFSTGAVSLSVGDAAAVTEHDDGWYRISVTMGMTNGTAYYFAFVPSGPTAIYAIAPQLEYGTVMSRYQPTSNTSFTTDTDRLVAQDSYHNILDDSVDLTTGNWSVWRVSVTDPSDVINPLGTLEDVWEVTKTGDTTSPSVYQEFPSFPGASGSYTSSVYAKNNDAQKLQVLVTDRTAGPQIVKVDFTFSTESISVSAGVDGGFEAAPNGWYRVWGHDNAFINGNDTDSLFGSYDSSIGESLYLWGPQLEYGTKMSRYQETP
jgi:hypothetical protein